MAAREDSTAETESVRTSPPWPVRLAGTLALGTVGGWIALTLGSPLPWMIGAMLITTAPAALGAPVFINPRLRTAFVTVLGVMLGSAFTPDILSELAAWTLSLAVLGAYLLVGGGLNVWFFQRVCGYDRVTAYFSAMPGGLSEMIVIGAEMGGDSRIISLTHASRVLLVVMILPFAFQLLLGYDPASRPSPGEPILDVAGIDLAILGGCAVAGYWGARLIRLPAAQVTGPMILSATIHLAGLTHASPPTEVIAAAQVVVGAAIGARFVGVDAPLIGRALIGALGGTVILLGATILFGGALAAFTGLEITSLVLAYSPGGLAEMSLVALALNIDTAFVATHHIVRIFMVVVAAPIAFRLVGGRPVGPSGERGGESGG